MANLIFAAALFWIHAVHGFRMVVPTSRTNTNLFSSTSVSEQTTSNNPSQATSILESYSNQQNIFTVEDGKVGLGGGTSASNYWNTLAPSEIETVIGAVRELANQADLERTSQLKKEDGSTYGRLMLGICAGNTAEAIQTLKDWVAGLKLPKGLLHGMDVDGVPVEIDGAVYVKYSTGGAMTFAEMRRSKRGFDALWRPGDAVLETYDGDFRGVYFNLELQDEVFRQYGVLPLNLFDDKKY